MDKQYVEERISELEAQAGNDDIAMFYYDTEFTQYQFEAVKDHESGSVYFFEKHKGYSEGSFWTDWDMDSRYEDYNLKEAVNEKIKSLDISEIIDNSRIFHKTCNSLIKNGYDYVSAYQVVNSFFQNYEPNNPNMEYEKFVTESVKNYENRLTEKTDYRKLETDLREDLRKDITPQEPKEFLAFKETIWNKSWQPDYNIDRDGNIQRQVNNSNKKELTYDEIITIVKNPQQEYSDNLEFSSNSNDYYLEKAHNAINQGMENIEKLEKEELQNSNSNEIKNDNKRNKGLSH